MALQLVILVPLEHIPMQVESLAHFVVLAISPPLRVLLNVLCAVQGNTLQTWAPPCVSCAQLGSTQLQEVPLVRSVVTPTSVPLDLQSANPVPPDKRSPPAGPATNQSTTQQVPARGGNQQTSS